MSINVPSLFDDFFSEEEKKEELFPDVPHVYDPEQNKENEGRENETVNSEVKQEEEERLSNVPIAQEIEEQAEEKVEEKVNEKVEGKVEENVEEKVDEVNSEKTSIIEKLSLKNLKKPTLELPGSTELDHQLLNEIISSDYTSFIHRDYPFNPMEIESVASKKDHIETSKLKNKVQEIEVEIPLVEIGKQDLNNNESSEEETEDSINTTLPEWELTKKYYPIGEVAKLFDVNISHIRFWTNEFNLNPRTTRKGDRLYTPSQINELKLIHYLVKIKKHTIKGAREKMKTQKETVGNSLKLKESLTELRDLLVQIQGSL